MKQLLITILLVGIGYSQCNESNWEEYYPEMSGCDLVGADLYGAYLYGANLSWSNLEGINLSYANLSWANLEGTNLSYANLSCANLAGVGVTNYTSFNYSIWDECGADENEDGIIDAFPVITVLDDALLVMFVSYDNNYMDAGAICTDSVDGNISSNVEVSGDIVNLAYPGIYYLTYSCTDSDNNETTASRAVVVINEYEDIDEDGYDDISFYAGSQSGDINGDGESNIIDIVIYVDNILWGE